MNLYIWKDPYKVQWGFSCLIVAAESEEEARELAPNAYICKYGWPNGAVLGPHNVPLGPPDYVLAPPTAMVYEWKE